MKSRVDMMRKEWVQYDPLLADHQCPFGKNRRAGARYTIYHHSPAVSKGSFKPLYSSTNQWVKDIYCWLYTYASEKYGFVSWEH